MPTSETTLKSKQVNTWAIQVRNRQPNCIVSYCLVKYFSHKLRKVTIFAIILLNPPSSESFVGGKEHASFESYEAVLSSLEGLPSLYKVDRVG